MSDYSIDTALIHAGIPHPRIEGAVSSPIFCSANFEYAGETNYSDLKYIRMNNTPNHLELHKKLAVIEKGEAALALASGMAAISTALMSVLKPGDHIIVQQGLYGGTHSFLTEDLVQWGVSHTFVDGADPRGWEAALSSTTKAFYVESMTNPLTKVGELLETVKFCRQHDLVSMIDNTFASPINFRPLEHGFDLVLHSATKYLNGHSDIVAGAVVGSTARVNKVLHLLNHLGGSLDPHACFLLTRGLKTLSLRMARQNSNALTLAKALQEHPAVDVVHYPGLETSPSHQRAKKFFSGYGGVLSFECQVDPQVFFDKLKFPVVAPSLGGVETLVTLPSNTSHAGVSPEDRAKAGIKDNLIRVAVGIEDPSDLVADFIRALR